MQGITFTLEGVDELTFTRVLRDVMQDAAFSKPLQIQATEPRTGVNGAQVSAALAIVFYAGHRSRAVNAMQRLKTVLLRHGIQVDSIHVPETPADQS